MPLNIKNPEVDRLARDLARRTGLSITDALLAALRESLERRRKQRSQPSLAEQLEEIGARCAALPDHDTRSPEEIIGFDEHGIPR